MWVFGQPCFYSAWCFVLRKMHPNPRYVLYSFPEGAPLLLSHSLSLSLSVSLALVTSDLNSPFFVLFYSLFYFLVNLPTSGFSTFITFCRQQYEMWLKMEYVQCWLKKNIIYSIKIQKRSVLRCDFFVIHDLDVALVWLITRVAMRAVFAPVTIYSLRPDFYCNIEVLHLFRNSTIRAKKS